MEGLTVKTDERYQLVDITSKVEKIVDQEGLENGVVIVFLPHSTAGVLITENESGLKEDWLNFLKDLVSGREFKHNRIDNNADSHILSGLVGQSKVLPIEHGKLRRGTWQQIFVAEFDGPRKRKVIVKILTG